MFVTTYTRGILKNERENFGVQHPATKTRGKEVLSELVQTKAHPEDIPEASIKEIEEILKIIKKSDYNIVEQLGQTP